ncbi:hypothetical protein OXX80_009596 [Metschnikowia pulcherrima]
MTLRLAAEFVDQQLAAWTQPRPLAVGISGPQGSGKSYLADHLLQHLAEKYPKLNCVGISIDDFYLTHSEQQKVSAEAQDSGNFVLVGRGLPGTHDLPLASRTMHDLIAGKPTKVPRYDKSAFCGEGDRFPEEDWQVVASPVNVIVFEGWFNGYRAINPAIFPAAYFSNDTSGVVQRSSMHHLESINAKLADYEELWDSFDYSIILHTQELDYVYRWRLQQEAALIAKHGSGMSESAVLDFVRRYMPMYHLYYWRMCQTGVSKKGTNLSLSIDFNRSVVSKNII